MLLESEIKEKIICHLKAEAACLPLNAGPYEFWTALSRTVVESLAENWQETTAVYQSGRQAHYFSAEFLQGRSLLNNLINLDLIEPVREAVRKLGFDLAGLEEQEIDPGLGSGGLGRLASCFLDSSAALNLPVTGYGLLYRYGLFSQKIENGFQREYPDAWMEKGYPFLVRRESDQVLIHYQDMDVWAVPFDLPVTGFHTANVNTLRLWQAEPVQEFDFELFNDQRYRDAVARRNQTEDICRTLYPNDTTSAGKTLRLRQQYLLASASLQSIVNRHCRLYSNDFSRFADLNSIQLNDTHPVIAIPELLRILTGEHQMTWEKAWPIVQRVFAYTNHTIMAEALEQWDIGIFRSLFPWILDIVTRIDGQFRQAAASRGLDAGLANQLAPLGNGRIRMANLASYASASINGVAALHTRILQQQTLRGFYQLWPEKFSNKTNGITPRRWLRLCNPELAGLLTELIGDESWVTDLSRLAVLENLAQDEKAMNRLMDIKRRKKVRLADYLAHYDNISINPDMLFDMQAKRLHEYKRQLLNALQILDQYFWLRDNPDAQIQPCAWFFGAKAAPGYYRAKAIIKFITEIARLINQDPVVRGRLQVIFLGNYRVSLAEQIIPAADVSEQISTVGMEASGTGNMKFMINGALTLGTCDGANIEIAEAAGEGNNYIFGCQAEDFAKTWGYYNPQWQYEHIPGLRRCVDALIDGTLSDGGTGWFRELHNSLIYGSGGQPADPYYVLGDFDEYRLTRKRLLDDYHDRQAWARKCWYNIIHGGPFSSDRTIREYAADIWHIEGRPIRV